MIQWLQIKFIHPKSGEKSMKAIIIARVSTEEQRDAGNSLPAQIARLEKYCQNKGFEILQICSFDESAYTNDRSEFDRIIDFILNQSEKIAVCCDKVDRLSRNVFDKRIAVLYEKSLCDQIELHFVSDGQVINSGISAVEKFQFSISLGLAKYYSDAISDNVRRAMEQKLRKGEWLSKAPYGYKNITKEDGNTDVIIDEYASVIVKKVFELYATGAFSTELLCKKIKAEHGIDWHKGYLAQLLSKPFYYGVMLIKGKEYPHRYPPIITQELFKQVQEVKTSFKKKHFKYAGKPYIYRGLLRCAHCGMAITPEKHKGHVYYHCTQYKGKHGAKWIREEAITEQLGTVFKNLQMPEEVFNQITQTLNEVHQNKIEFHNKEFDKLTREQKNLTTMLDNLYLDRLKGRITENDYDRFYQTLRDQMTDVTVRLESLQGAEDNYYTTAKYVLSVVKRAHEIFESSEVEEKRQLIKLVLSNLMMEEEKIVWNIQKPFNLFLNLSDSIEWRG
jgi:site-specific DNA recombinase